MKKTLGALSVLVLAGAGGLVLTSIVTRQKDSYLTPELNESFNADYAPPPPAEAPAAPQASMMPMRDAVASPRLFVPAAPPAAIFAPVKAAAKPPYPVADNKLFQGLTAAPARFIVSKTLLGKPDRFIAFASDPAKARRYVSHPLVQGVLNNQTLLKGFLSPAMTSAFLSSPAMKNPRAVRALARSPLLKEIAANPGVQKFLNDPDTGEQVFNNPQLALWMARNPDGAAAFASLTSGLASSIRPR